jgi:RNA polymerase sigma-70 factor (ECF subfamily)
MADPKPIVQPELQPAPADDPAFFRDLFRREHGYVWHSLRRLGIPERDLEDVTHDVFVVVHRKLARFDRARPLRPWLIAIAARVAADYRRLARNQRERIDGVPEVADAAAGAQARLEAIDAQQLVIAALQAIDESRRVVFVLVELDEQPVTEVARALAIPVNTAYSKLRLARQEFATAVRRYASDRGAS